MEYTVAQKSSEGYVNLTVKGTELSVVKSSISTKLSPAFSYAFQHNITCCSNTLSSHIHRGHDYLPLVQAIGLQDGSIFLLNVTQNRCSIKLITETCKLKSAVDTLLSGPGFIFAGSALGECALFYSEAIVQDEAATLQCIRVDVSLLTRTAAPSHATYFTSSSASQPRASIPCLATTFSIAACQAERKDHMQRQALHNLLIEFLDVDPATFISTTVHSSSEVTTDPLSDTQVVLIGCSDGTVWWLQPPSHSRVWEMGSELVADMALECTLLDTFTLPVQKIFLADMHVTGAANDRGLTPCIVVVERGGAATLLSTRGAGRRCREVRQLPVTADLASLVCYKGVFAYIDSLAGRLCAASGVSGDAVGVLTPITSPRILSFHIETCAESGVKCDNIILHTDDAIHCLPLCCSSDAVSTAGVVDMLQKACGGGDKRHPLNLIPVKVKVIADTDISTATTTTADARHVQSLTQVAAQLSTTGRQNEEVLRRTVEADLQVLQLTALLQELPGLLTAVSGGGRVSGVNRSVSEGSATVLSNPTGSVEVTCRLRSEPAPVGLLSGSGLDSGSSSSGSGGAIFVYCDLTIRTHTVQAMRALQDRQLLVRLQSSLPTTSLHPAVQSTGVRVQLSPVTGDSSGKGDNWDCEYRTTLHVSGCMQRLSSYRLTLAVVVEAPRDVRHTDTRRGGGDVGARVESISVLLPLVDHEISAAKTLPHVLAAGMHDALSTLQQLIGGDSGGSEDANAAREFTLSIASSTTADDSDRVFNSYEGAVDGHSRQVGLLHRSSAYHSSGNPLQAAFLGNQTSSRLFNLGTNTAPKNDQGRRGIQKQKLTLQSQRTLHTPSSGAAAGTRARATPVAADSNSADTKAHALTGSSRSLLATVAADLHAQALLACPPRDSREVPVGIEDIAFLPSDALHLAPDTQQAMVRAAHLARKSHPQRSSHFSVEAALSSVTAAWELYGEIRSTEI